MFLYGEPKGNMPLILRSWLKVEQPPPLVHFDWWEDRLGLCCVRNKRFLAAWKEKPSRRPQENSSLKSSVMGSSTWAFARKKINLRRAWSQKPHFSCISSLPFTGPLRVPLRASGPASKRHSQVLLTKVPHVISQRRRTVDLPVCSLGCL